MKNSAKIIHNEKNELSRLQKMQKRSSGSKYFLILLVLIAVVNILDEVTSNLTVTVQSSFVTEFFVSNPFMGKYYSYEDGLAFRMILTASGPAYRRADGIYVVPINCLTV